jgi:hypothetical protein
MTSPPLPAGAGTVEVVVGAVVVGVGRVVMVVVAGTVVVVVGCGVPDGEPPDVRTCSGCAFVENRCCLPRARTVK